MSITSLSHAMSGMENDFESLFKILVLNRINHDHTNPEASLLYEGKRIPKINPNDYLDRLITYTKPEKSTLVLTVVYLDKYCNAQKISITYRNFHRLILTALTLALKFCEDLIFNNLFYGKIGGVTTAQLNSMEMDFLKTMNWELYVSDLVFNCYQNKLLSVSEGTV